MGQEIFDRKIGGGRKKEVNGRRKWKTSPFIGVKGSAEWPGQIETHGGFMESNGKGVYIKLWLSIIEIILNYY